MSDTGINSTGTGAVLAGNSTGVSASAGVERRAAERGSAELGVKILRPAVARYLVGRTEDVSRGGALMRVQTSRPLTPGEDLAVGVVWGSAGESGAVLRRDGLVTATVVRVDEPEHHAVGTRGGGGWTQRVAVRFARSQPEADGAIERGRAGTETDTVRVASAA